MPNRSRNKAGDKTGFDYIVHRSPTLLLAHRFEENVDAATVGGTKRVVFGAFGTSW